MLVKSHLRRKPVIVISLSMICASISGGATMTPAAATHDPCIANGQIFSENVLGTTSYRVYGNTGQHFLYDLTPLPSCQNGSIQWVSSTHVNIRNFGLPGQGFAEALVLYTKASTG
jgi:hypothetical protein